LQKSPQVALKPHCLFSRVIALQRQPAAGTARPFFAAATATVSEGFGGSLVIRILCRPAIRATDFSLARRAVSAIFSGSGCPESLAILKSFCQRSLSLLILGRGPKVGLFCRSHAGTFSGTICLWAIVFEYVVLIHPVTLRHKTLFPCLYQMNPRKFGPYFWGALHAACFDPADMTALRNFIFLFPFVLPCSACRVSFMEILQELPPPTCPRQIFAWSVEAHNRVNYKLGKPMMGLTEATRIWSASTPETFTDFF